VTWGLRCASSRARVTGTRAWIAGGVVSQCVAQGGEGPPSSRSSRWRRRGREETPGAPPRSRFVSRPATAYIVHPANELTVCMCPSPGVFSCSHSHHAALSVPWQTSAGLSRAARLGLSLEVSSTCALERVIVAHLAHLLHVPPCVIQAAIKC